MMKKIFLLLLLIPSLLYTMEQTQETHTVMPSDPTTSDRFKHDRETYLTELMHRFSTMDNAATYKFVISTEFLEALPAIPKIADKYPHFRPTARYDLECYILFLKAQRHTLKMTQEVSPYHAFNFNFSAHFAFSPEEVIQLLTTHLDEIEGIKESDTKRRQELVAAYFHGICEGFIPENNNLIGPDLLKVKLCTKYDAKRTIVPGIPDEIITRIQQFDESQHFDLLKQITKILLTSYPTDITFEPSSIGRKILDFVPFGFASNNHFRIFNSKGERKNKSQASQI